MITFRTEVYANIDMFDEVALQLLKMMGHSATVPGAILADDVPRALTNLQSALFGYKDQTTTNVEDDDTEPTVSLGNRAFPLLELLNAAAKKEADVMWEKH